MPAANAAAGIADTSLPLSGSTFTLRALTFTAEPVCASNTVYATDP